MIRFFGSIWSALVGVNIPPVVANFARTEVKLTTAERGTYAAQALNNPVMAEAFDELEREALTLWSNTVLREIEEREFLWGHVKALRQLRIKLAGYINEAKINEHNRDSRTGKTGNQDWGDNLK